MSYVPYRTLWIYLDIYIRISCILRRIHRIVYIRLLYSWHCFSMCLHHHYHVCKSKTFAMVAVHQCPCCTIVLFGPYADNLCSSTVSTCNGLPCNNLPCKTRTACENLRVAPCASHAAGQWNHRSSSSTPWSGFLVCSALKYLNLGQLVSCMSFAQSSEVGNQCLPVVQGWLIGGSHAVMQSHTRNVVARVVCVYPSSGIGSQPVTKVARSRSCRLWHGVGVRSSN